MLPRGWERLGVLSRRWGAFQTVPGWLSSSPLAPLRRARPSPAPAPPPAVGPAHRLARPGTAWHPRAGAGQGFARHSPWRKVVSGGNAPHCINKPAQGASPGWGSPAVPARSGRSRMSLFAACGFGSGQEARFLLLPLSDPSSPGCCSQTKRPRVEHEQLPQFSSWQDPGRVLEGLPGARAGLGPVWAAGGGLTAAAKTAGGTVPGQRDSHPADRSPTASPRCLPPPHHLPPPPKPDFGLYRGRCINADDLRCHPLPGDPLLHCHPLLHPPDGCDPVCPLLPGTSLPEEPSPRCRVPSSPSPLIQPPAGDSSCLGSTAGAAFYLGQYFARLARQHPPSGRGGPGRLFVWGSSALSGLRKTPCGLPAAGFALAAGQPRRQRWGGCPTGRHLPAVTRP